jgi:hypothetical protein
MKTAKKHTFKLAFMALLCGAIFSTACEDVIQIDLDEGTPELAVDAFITDVAGTQLIRLTITSAYFENTPSNAALGAVVTVSDDLGNQYAFADALNDGNYQWNAANADTSMIQVGSTYTLAIDYNGQVFEAMTMANPVPLIDSIGYEYREEELGAPEGYYAAFYAVDNPGREDWYWIRTYRNDSLINDPARINISKDAAFGGSGADGFTFIIPIREAITPSGDPYSEGDNVRVQLWSISQETYEWLQETQSQLGNGGLFATPPSNVRTNIFNVNVDSEVTAVGMFNVSMQSEDSRTIQ